MRVEDVSDTIENLRSSGVTIDTEPHVIFHHDDGALGAPGTDEWHAFFRDSENNLVGLVALADATTP
ncbi:MAG: VOC family protein [Acidimicrobiales bacterium]